MKLLVTGAAGKLGREVCLLLRELDIDFVATDHHADPALPYSIYEVDLLNLVADHDMLQDVDVLLHLANHPNFNSAEGSRVYTENVSMNIRLFQAVTEAGCRRIIFSSSIQLINGMLPTMEREDQDILLPYLPLDSNLPAIPRNMYALSKQASEEMLKYLSRSVGMVTIALRFPWLLNAELLQRCYNEDGIKRGKCFDGYAYLPIYSAAEACVHSIDAKVTGYKQYFLASKDNIEQRSAGEVIAEQLSHIPQKQSIESLDSLIDCRIAEEELGWRQPRSLDESIEKYNVGVLVRND